MKTSSNNIGFRILFLLPFAPRLDTPHGGGRVVSQFINAISSRHRIGILMLRGVDEPPMDDAIKDRCEFVEEVVRGWAGNSLPAKMYRAGRLAAAVIKNKPMWISDWESLRFANKVRIIVDTWKPDIIQAEFGVMGQYFSATDRFEGIRILTEYEPGILAGPYLKAGPAIIRSYTYKRDKKAWRRYEPSILKRADAAIVFTNKDRKALESFKLSVPIYTIPFGIQLPDRPLDPLGARMHNLLFIGNFLHPPNIEAAMRLVSDIYPKVREKYPDLKLYIVGNQPPRGLKNKLDRNIVVTGWVEDIQPYLNQASLVIVPIKSGGGMRVKVMDALAAGKAVITTKLGVEGLDVRDREHVFIAESDEEFSQAISQLLDNPVERETLAGKAREWACKHLSWELSIQKYEEIYKSLVNQAEDECSNPK